MLAHSVYIKRPYFYMKRSTLSGNSPKRNLIAEIIASLLMIFFVHTLISTYVNLQSLKNMLPFYTSHKNAVAWTIVSTEAMIILLLFFPKTRLIGLAVVLLVSLFAGYIVIQFSYNPHHFGGILNKFSDTQHILFYSLLAGMAIAGSCLLLLKRKRHEDHLIEPPIYT
jgi:hypothetical protein